MAGFLEIVHFSIFFVIELFAESILLEIVFKRGINPPFMLLSSIHQQDIANKPDKMVKFMIH